MLSAIFTCILGVQTNLCRKAVAVTEVHAWEILNVANLCIRTDAGKLLVEFEELNEFRGVLGFLCNLCNEVARTGGKF